MGEVFRERGYVGKVYPDDHDPPHVHIEKGGSNIKIDAATFQVISIKGDTPKSKELKIAKALTQKYQATILTKWEEYFGES